MANASFAGYREEAQQRPILQAGDKNETSEPCVCGHLKPCETGIVACRGEVYRSCDVENDTDQNVARQGLIETNPLDGQGNDKILLL